MSEEIVRLNEINGLKNANQLDEGQKYVGKSEPSTKVIDKTNGSSMTYDDPSTSFINKPIYFDLTMGNIESNRI